MVAREKDATRFIERAFRCTLTGAAAGPEDHMYRHFQRGKDTMKLKDDRRLQGQWPPVVWGGVTLPAPPPDVGVLVDVKCCDPPPSGHITLVKQHEGRRFSTQIIVDDAEFRHALYEKLRQCTGQTMERLGQMELNL